MVAPAVIGGTGTAVTVTAVTATTATISGASVNVWQLTISSALTITKGAIMVEAEEAGSDKKMLVQTINGVFDCDTDFFEQDNIDDIGVTRDQTTGEITAVTDSDFYKARYQYTPSLGGLMWIHKMSPMPQCVLDLNMCNIPCWYHVNWQLNGKKGVVATNDVDKKVDSYHLEGITDPTTSTAAPLHAEYINTTDSGVFKCVGIDNSGDTPSYTWVEVTVS